MIYFELMTDHADPDRPTRTDARGVIQLGPAQLYLIVVSGPDQGKQLLLVNGTYHVGKGRDCDLALTDSAVSRRHLEVAILGSGVLVNDLESKNGSFYQGARLTRATLSPGAVIRIGSSELKLVPVHQQAALLPSSADRFGGLLGRSLVMRELFARLERIAASDGPVLIEGETGTGKDLCAEAIHRMGAREKAPYVVCDLAALGPSLIESELFGHRKGAFTGADRDRPGAFSQADGGTLFIDEIGELSRDLQPRLLRATEKHQVKPLGASQFQTVDVRVIAATNRDLREESVAGRFREDLYQRLAVLRAVLPPLRERKEDLELLVPHLLSEKVQVSDHAMAILMAYDWPGNVRELRNTLERARVLVGDSGILRPQHLELDPERPVSAEFRLGPNGFHEEKERVIASWERACVTDLLRRSGGNISLAARRGGLNRTYFYRLMKKHGFDQEEP
jgi:DNA-binding NtrC family response regulator